jgi:alkylated DNA repair protein (DNA oxidative demethylase)
MGSMPPRPSRWRVRNSARGSGTQDGHIYERDFLSPGARTELVRYLTSLHPIWEERFSAHNPPPPGQKQRRLLRPVYWLGNWQFACLDYYRPPNGIRDRCVKAEPFPAVLAELVAQIEAMARLELRESDIPKGWHLDTCLVNFYGDRREGEKLVDVARVGEHKDFEPGPVASISLGERALLQFVRSQKPGERDEVVLQQWLEDSSLQLFGGARWKDHLFHRVQRVERKGAHRFPLHLNDFETRRINLTLRYVPDQHVIPYANLSTNAASDVRGYMETLARHAPFFAKELAARI